MARIDDDESCVSSAHSLSPGVPRLRGRALAAVIERANDAEQYCQYLWQDSTHRQAQRLPVAIAPEPLPQRLRRKKAGREAVKQSANGALQLTKQLC